MVWSCLVFLGGYFVGEPGAEDEQRVFRYSAVHGGKEKQKHHYEHVEAPRGGRLCM